MKLKKIIKEHSLGELPSSKLIKMKSNPLTEGGFSNIKRPRDISRMEGLHNLKHMKEMLKYASLLYQDTGQNLISASMMTPTFADIDNDGDFDFFTGNVIGTVTFYENVGMMWW